MKEIKKCCGTCKEWMTGGDSPYCGIAIPKRDALHGWTDYCTYHHPPCKDYKEKK